MNIDTRLQKQRTNYIHLVQRILVKYIEQFQELEKDIEMHIPHKYSKELTQKTDHVRTLIEECTTLNFDFEQIEQSKQRITYSRYVQ